MGAERRATYNEYTTTPQRRLSRVVFDAGENLRSNEDVITILVTDSSVQPIIRPLVSVLMRMLKFTNH